MQTFFQLLFGEKVKSTKYCNFLPIFIVYLTCGVILNSNGNALADQSGSGTGISTSTQNVNYIIDYLLTLKRSQDEIFRKIDWLTKAVESKDHEDYKFRLKFSRKVHSLENKVLTMEQDFTHKVEEIVQRKMDEMMSMNDQLPIRPRHAALSSPARVSSRDSHEIPPYSVAASTSGDILNGNSFQNQQPSPYLPYQPQHYPHSHHHNRQHSQIPFQSIHGRGGGKWDYYEHPITHKRVRGGGNMYGFVEPPTRDLPQITVAATAQTKTLQSGNGDSFDYSSTMMRTTENTKQNEFDEGHSSGGGETTTLRSVMENFDDSQKRIENIEDILQTLEGNMTNMQREMGQSKAHDTSELHKMLVDHSKEIQFLHQKHQEMVHRVEQFTVEMERIAARREHSVNESLKEMSAELKKQVNALKGFTKRQVQNITTMTSNLQQQTPDKLKCAQTLLDELLIQLYPPTKGRHRHTPTSPMIADQAEGSGQSTNMDDYNGRLAKLMAVPAITNNEVHHDIPNTVNHANEIEDKTEDFTKELQIQRKEITALKSEVAKLNISQLLLTRTVDEETLKGSELKIVRPRDCSEIRLLRNVGSGIYSIFPNMNDKSMNVLCDMTADGGGWTVIQRRGMRQTNAGENATTSSLYPTTSFSRNWKEYEDGFGSLNGDFWLGLSAIASLSNLGIQQLRVELTDWDGQTGFANYQYFKVANASNLYRLYVSDYSGTVGDSLTRHNNMPFSTPDKDNDVDPWRHCAKTYNAGWWYYSCFESNLNGVYLNNNGNGSHSFGTGIVWQHWKGSYYSLKHVEMKIRNTFIGDNQFANV